jgi:hypothetical protein
MEWYMEFHLTENNFKFRRSERGRESAAAKSPFLEDESLTIKFKAWARGDLEHLTVSKVTEWVNTDLLKDWTANQFLTNRINYPVSQNVAARWMREAGFCYCGHKKSYYVDRHEDTDVVESRNEYIVTCFEEELYEHCWVQLTKPNYLKTKLRKKQEKLARNTKIKQESGTHTNKQSKQAEGRDEFAAVEMHLDSKAYHYKDPVTGSDMVEVHVDTVYSYDEGSTKLPAGIPPLPKIGGYLSIRKPIGSKPRVVFGQDEAIYRSAQLNESCWMIDGQQTLCSKTEGKGRMVSAVCSREFGFGLYPITIQEMQKIN